MRNIARTLLPLLLATTAIAGCDKLTGSKKDDGAKDNGVAALSADEILAKARTAMLGAGSFRMKGDVKTDNGRIALDMKIRGEDVAGQFTILNPDSTPRGKVEAIRVGSEAFFKGDGDFWRSLGGDRAEATAELLENKWVKPTEGDKMFTGLLEVTNPDDLLESGGNLVKGETKKVGETGVVALKEGETTLYVATTGEPYPVRMEGPPGEGQIDLSEFGATFEEIKAPPADQVVDMAKVKRTS